MTKIVQLRGGTRAESDVLIGAVRELTVDTDGDELRLHDGVLAGGFRILNLDANNLRYQAKNLDLTAITQLSPTTPGILVKRGEANYSLREIAVDTDHLTIANGNGLNGNPTLGLATTIADAHTFSDTITFTSEIIGSGGFNGNVTGNITGNSTGTHTGPVTGNVTGNVIGNLTGDSAGTHTGSVDISGATFTTDNEQIPLTAIANNANIVLAGNAFLVPQFGIIPFAGTPAQVPTGWAICDGQNGTPDLRGTFIYGAGDGGGSPNTGDTGGSTTHGHGSATTTSAGGHTPSVTVQGHALTVDQIPNHDHLGPVPSENNAANQFDSDSTTANWFFDTNTGTPQSHGRTEKVGGGQTHTHPTTAAAVPDHDHDVTVAAANHLPPYHALLYIMKL